MKSIQFDRYGSPDYLRFVEKAIPSPKPDEVLVKICASSINSWDWELLHARPFANRVMFGLFKPTRLKTLGIDIAGCVEKTGSEVKKFKVGDKVYGDLSACGMGGYAEYVAAPESALAHMPENISFEQAASVPQAALMSLQGLQQAGIRDGQHVLINGASGGSGTFAIQIAKTFDVEITGVCSGAKMDFVRSLGVDHVIDYQTQDYTRSGQQYDVIIDAQAHHGLRKCKRALSPGGSYVAHGGASGIIAKLILFGPLLSRIDNKKVAILFHKANKGLDEIGELLARGKITPVIDQVFPFDKTIDALRYYGDGLAKGKVVISME
ncbi:MAG: NAD(P)-dependent alcohol dehydrogenase [Gammaproteobacteria bacterium]|nr:NAD(P)-dependent alcohol dehydrogenase [Gammaproteobacteria bacterium]